MRPRVLSFISAWAGSPTSSAPTSPPKSPLLPQTADSPASNTPPDGSPIQDPPSPKPPRGPETPEKRHSRRGSMIMAYNPPTMVIEKDTPPELQPIFTYLNDHANKLYQEGYFLKLHDLDSRGRPSADRVWTECFAQLVGTVLSLWDAAQLDAAGEDGEVMPTFINLTDASIKMIESLPMNGVDGQSLQNVLSLSTAANNRYLLHFNSLHSLTQWTAGIRLAMFEHSCLQEAYTGSIIAGKGKYLNNIRSIMERARHPIEDWARVRFGAGTPWRRCWCVISPPDEKEVQKALKTAKKRSAYEKPPVVKGDIKFYETRKITKKTRPIATITNAYTAYAIYPQSKPLIDQSTLVKVDGTITIHSTLETKTEGFIFVMPEVHPAITGFEMMIRWLLPTFDTFALYGRPSRLIPDVRDVRSLMFGMPTGQRYGHLDLIDVAGLIHTEGSQAWSEREWRKQLKNLTSKRMLASPSGTARSSSVGDQALSSAGRASLNLPSSNPRSKPGKVTFGGSAIRSSPGTRQASPSRDDLFSQRQGNQSDTTLNKQQRSHQRSASDLYRPTQSSRLSFEQSGDEQPPAPPAHNGSAPPPPPTHGSPALNGFTDKPLVDSPVIGYSEEHGGDVVRPPRVTSLPHDAGDAFPPSPPRPIAANEPMRPVAAPPSMAHKSNSTPPRRPNQAPDMRRGNMALDPSTLAQIKDSNPAGTQAQYRNANGNGMGAGMGMGTGLGMGMGERPHGPPPVRDPNQQTMYNYQNGPPQLRQQMPPPSEGMRWGGGPPPSQQQQQHGTLALPDRRLPTIPGTPAGELERFDLGGGDVPHSPPKLQNSRSAGNIARKPLPGSSPSLGGY